MSQREGKDASSVQEVRKDNSMELFEMPNVYPMAWLTRAEEEALSAEADYWEGVLRGDA